MLDVMKILYWHVYDYLSMMVGSRLPPLDAIWSMSKGDNAYLEELINDWGLVVWNRESLMKMKIDRVYEDFVECYAIETNQILDSFFDDDGTRKLPQQFLSEFNAKDDFDKISKVCQQQSDE